MTAKEWIALISVILGFIATNVGHIITGKSNNNKMLIAIQQQSNESDAKLDKTIAVYAAKTDTKIEELTREVREHNNFAQKVPRLEKEIELIERKLNM